MRHPQTTNLGVRSSNLFGRARLIIDFKTKAYVVSEAHFRAFRLSRCWRAGLRRAERSSRALRNLLECWVQPSLSSPSASVRTGCSNTSTPRLRRRSASRGSVCHRRGVRDLMLGGSVAGSAGTVQFTMVRGHGGDAAKRLMLLVSLPVTVKQKYVSRTVKIESGCASWLAARPGTNISPRRCTFVSSGCIRLTRQDD
jgi:hypothetical protein